MKVNEFLEHHGIAGNPFAEEDAQTDSVFKRDCLETTFHPAWDKILGSPAEPSTSIVFGEKGSGKTALKLQMVRQFERHNAAHPEARTFVVLYDDFNPFLDRFVGRVAHGRSVEKTLAQWKLWDHMDAILSLGVTQLVTELVADKRPPRLTRPQARDLALLAACYDQSTAESFPVRWRKLRRRVGYHGWLGGWPRLLGLAVTAALVGGLVAGALLDRLDWAGRWWPWAIVGAAWIPAGLRRLKSTWRAWRIAHSMRTGNRTVGQLARALAAMPEVDLAGQPLPAHARSDDRYELFEKLQGVLAALGWTGMVVIDEPHLINGSADRMKQVIWPLLDNKFLKSPGLGFKLLLPEELYRFIERENEQFNQRARLDKQNLVPALEWSGETLYDIASARVKAASVGTPPATLSGLFDESVDQEPAGAAAAVQVSLPPARLALPRPHRGAAGLPDSDRAVRDDAGGVSPRPRRLRPGPGAPLA